MVSAKIRKTAMAINGNRASQDRVLWIAGIIEALAAAFIIFGLIASAPQSNSLLERERSAPPTRMIQ